MGKAASVLIPDDDENEPGPTSAPVIPGTPTAEAVANSQKLGPSVRGKPVGMPKLVRVVLDEVDEIPPTGQMVSLNGRAYLIKPGEEVDLPEGVLEILDNAIMSVPIVDSQTLKVIGHRNRPRFPYRRVSGRV